jgi:HK97 family phage portal protein
MRGILTAARDLLFAGWNGKQVGTESAVRSDVGWVVQPVTGIDKAQITPSNYESQIAANQGPVHASLSLIAKQVGDATLRIYRPKRKTSKSALHWTRTREIPARKKSQLLEKAAPGSVLSLADDAEEIVGNHRLIDLLQMVSPVLDTYQLQYLIAGYLGLLGNDYMVLLKDSLGIPNAIWNAPAEFMRIKRGADGWISGYVYKRGSMKKEFSTDEVVHIKAPAPGAMFEFYGRGDLMGAAEDFNLLMHMYQFETALFENGGMPATLLSVQGSWSEEQRTAFRQAYDQRFAGSKKAGKTMVGEGGVKVEHLGFNPREMAYQGARKFSNTNIYSNFGTPEAMFTGQVSTRAALDASFTQILQFGVKPYLTLIQQALNAQLVPLYSDPIYVEYDEVVPEDKEFKLKEDVDLVDAGIRTINQVRIDRGEVPVDGGDVPYININKVPLGTEVERGAQATIEDIATQALQKARERYWGNG